MTTLSRVDETTWRDPAWVADGHAWIDERLAALGRTRTGEILQPHVAPWSTVMRVPVGDEVVFFKANTDDLRHEAAVVELLSARVPEHVPALLASDAAGWMLMADAGETLREVVPREGSLDRWLDALRRYAEVQLAVTDQVDDLLALGVPDLRLDVLPGKYAALVDEIGADRRFVEAVPWVQELADELAAYGIAETLQHDDLHDAQVFVQGDRHLLMDWGDACISHPFFTLAVTIEGVIAWGLDDVENSVDVRQFIDAYLGSFLPVYPDVDLHAAAATATRLGWACRAVNGHVPGDDRQTNTRLRMFLDGRP